LYSYFIISLINTNKHVTLFNTSTDRSHLSELEHIFLGFDGPNKTDLTSPEFNLALMYKIASSTAANPEANTNIEVLFDFRLENNALQTFFEAFLKTRNGGHGVGPHY
jgi:hypothetical protein